MENVSINSQKKKWETPNLVLINQNTITTGKIHPSVHEGTGRQDGMTFSTPFAVHFFVGTKYQAALS